MQINVENEVEEISDCDNRITPNKCLLGFSASPLAIFRTCSQVHIHGQWMLPSLMHSFLGHSSIRELCPPANLIYESRGKKKEKGEVLHLSRCYTHTHTPLHKEAFRHRHFYREAFARRSLYKQKLLLREASTQTGGFTHRSFHTEKPLRRPAFTHRFLFHRAAFTQSSFYTPKLWHREAFTQRSVYTCRVSSLVRFYKSRFWFFSEKKSEFFVNQISEKFVNPEIFCCQPFKNERKLVVLLLFSKFSASFSYFWPFPRTKSGGKLVVLLLISNCLHCLSRILTNVTKFSDFFRLFSEISENFLKFSDFFSDNFWKNCESRYFLLPAIQKWRKTSCFAAAFKVFS